VRRTDFTGGTVSSAINIPAHGFHVVRGGLFGLCRQAGVRKVVFYCGEYEKQVRTWMRGY
jgi:arsenical-resistance protein 2